MNAGAAGPWSVSSESACSSNSQYQRAIRAAIPHAEICFDPVHVVQLAGRATDRVRRDEWNRHDRSHTPQGRRVKHTRWSLLKAPENQTISQLARLHEVQQTNKTLYRAFMLREELRLLYRLPDPALAPAPLDAWLAWASRSKLKPFVRLARTLRGHRDGILAAVRLGVSNGRLEGLNSKTRLISHGAFGYHSADPLIAMIYPVEELVVTGDPIPPDGMDALRNAGHSWRSTSAATP